MGGSGMAKRDQEAHKAAKKAPIVRQAVVVCCGCFHEIKPEQVACCPHCAAMGKDWHG